MTIRNQTQTQNNSELQNLLKQLEDSPIHFFLTGSRFFGHAKESSDWDFYTQDSRVTRNILEGMGFRIYKREQFLDLIQLPGEGYHAITDAPLYDDDNIVSVARHPLGVDIQLQRDLGLKFMAQEMVFNQLNKNGYGKLNKNEARDLWNRTYKFIRMHNNAKMKWQQTSL